MKVAVIGASGFLGDALYHHLQAHGGVSVTPIVHSSGNVWNLARSCEPLVFVDLLDAAALSDALAGCTHVVNCSRGKQDAMLTGLDNIIAACRRQHVNRLVHISSVAIYGTPAVEIPLTEDASTADASGYGALKLRQDEKVIAANGNGLETVILCPPNIAGRASRFMEDVWNALAAGQLALVDGGTRPFNAVDVDNLCHAIVLALRAQAIPRPRYLIADGGSATWGSFVEELQALSGRHFSVMEIDADVAAAYAAQPAATRPSVAKSLKRLVSSDVREALRKDPLLAAADKKLRGLVAKLPGDLENRVRRSVEGTVHVPHADLNPPIDVTLAAAQLPRFRYSIENARRDLGFHPPNDTRASLANYLRWRQAWNEHLQGFEDLFADLEPGSAFLAS